VAFTTSYGVNLAAVDIDDDGQAEVYAAPGADATAPAVLRGFAWPATPGADLEPMLHFWDVAPFGIVAPAATHGATLGVGFV